ncbi:cytochrome C oxidase subunit IV family protein [Marinilabilia rubra]|uniref:Cytochrome-c oxidase n=1 Tax=Marinilabilia rubra TaxID=2162893 RepID=A0A2U2BA30_9BACT|nr:cytochrome C oxidase subunit IV family protein [Marinilabilia rubra]PWD99886.1 cytochrome-c oxidase [Marinilabilia rubra]
MEKPGHHILSYNSLLGVLVALLSLTALSVWITNFNFGTLSVGVALLVAAIKGATVLTYFMHLKFESRILKLMVGGVFLLFALVIIITFIDYLLR